MPFGKGIGMGSHLPKQPKSIVCLQQYTDGSVVELLQLIF